MKPKKSNIIPYHSDQELILPADTGQSFAISARDWETLYSKVSSLSASATRWELAFSVSFSVLLSFLVSALASLAPQEVSPSSQGVQGILSACYWLITAFSFGVTVVTFVAMKQQKNMFTSNKEDLLKNMDDIHRMYVKGDTSDLSKPDPFLGNLTLGELRRDDGLGEDELYETAKKVAIDSGKVSTSLLQRKLRIGYARAARIVERMESEGFAGPADGARPRTVRR